MNTQTKLALTDDARKVSVTALEQYLADSYVLYAKTQGFHWNVLSSDFVALHELWQSQYENLAESIDETAERIRMLGAFPVASLTTFVERSQLREVTTTDMSDVAMLTETLHDHEAMVRFLREQIPLTQAPGDEGTADYFIGRLRWHEKTAWFVQSTIAGRSS